MNAYELPEELIEISEKELRKKWYRYTAHLMNVIGELESELKRMKENPKIPNDRILKKDNQINELVEFYNESEKIIQSLYMIIKMYKLNEKLNGKIFNDHTGANI